MILSIFNVFTLTFFGSWKMFDYIYANYVFFQKMNFKCNGPNSFYLGDDQYWLSKRQKIQNNALWCIIMQNMHFPEID